MEKIKFFSISLVVIAIVLVVWQYTKQKALAGLDGVKEIADSVNSIILERIKNLDIPWRKTWRVDRTKKGQSLTARNYLTKNPYSGINFILHNFIFKAERPELTINYLTFNQVREMGGSVVKGAKGYPVFYYAVSYKKDGKNIPEEEYKRLYSEGRKDGLDSFFFKKYYHVFNEVDITGIEFEREPISPPATETEKVQNCEMIIEGMKKRPPIYFVKNSDRAYYTRLIGNENDPGVIRMPQSEQFESVNEFYSTLFHELIHFSLRKSGEFSIDKMYIDYDKEKKYAFEELCAELGACYLCSEAGIWFEPLQKNSTAYLKNWAGKLTKNIQDDPDFIFRASALAQKAVDWILQYDEQDVPKFIRMEGSPITWRDEHVKTLVPLAPGEARTQPQPAKTQMSLFGVIAR